MSDEEEIREAVDVAKAPGTFNIVDVLQNRSYPETQVSVVLEEGRVYEAAMLEEEIQKIEGKTSAKAKAALEDLVAKRESMREELINSMHTFYLMGIPEGKREELYSQAKKKYPIMIYREYFPVGQGRKKILQPGMRYSLITSGRRILKRLLTVRDRSSQSFLTQQSIR